MNFLVMRNSKDAVDDGLVVTEEAVTTFPKDFEDSEKALPP